MQTTLHNFRIAGIASAVPEQRLPLTELGDRFGHQEVERIIKGTGVREVRIAPPELCTSDLCQAAAAELLDKLGLQPAAIDGLIFVSQTPDWRVPPTSPALQARLGLSKETVAFDINYGCSGYIYGLFQAGMLIQTGACQRVLLCVGDTNSKLIHPEDKQVRMVFGDGASATLVEHGPNTTWPFVIGTDGTGGDALKIPAGESRYPHSPVSRTVREVDKDSRRTDDTLYMDGMTIMNFALREVPPAIDTLLTMQDWQSGDVSVYAFHQANKFMLDYLRRKMKLPAEAVPVGIEKTGNTGPASIPLLLTLEQERLRRERGLTKTVMCGFGVGLSWAATAGDLSDTVFPDLLEVS